MMKRPAKIQLYPGLKTALKFQPYYQKLETGILEILNREYL